MKDWEKDLIGRMIFALIAGTSIGVIIILVARAAKYLFG